MEAAAHSPGRELLSLIADARRWRILELLGSQGRTVGELVTEMAIAQPAVSHHLSRLRRAGLVEPVVEGRTRRYRWATAIHGSPEAGLQTLLRVWFDPQRAVPAAAIHGQRAVRADIDIHLL